MASCYNIDRQTAPAEARKLFGETKPDKVRESTTEIARLIREDIKTAKKAGLLPKALKVSVRRDYFAGGSSIDCMITKAPFLCINPEYIAEYDANPHQFGNYEARPLTIDCYRALQVIQLIVDQYNYDNSDSMTDYFDVNFYDHVSIHWEYESNEKAQIRAAQAQGLNIKPREMAA